MYGGFDFAAYVSSNLKFLQKKSLFFGTLDV